MMTLHFFNDVANDAESTQKWIITSCSLFWRVNQLVPKWNTRFVFFDIKFTRLCFKNTCWIPQQASRCQQAFSKPCLVNLISKDTHLVFSIYISWKTDLDFGDFLEEKIIAREIYMSHNMWFTQCDILTSVDSDEPVQPPIKHRNLVSSFTVV